MFYFHPWELDSEEMPPRGMARLLRRRAYGGRGRMRRDLRRLLTEFGSARRGGRAERGARAARRGGRRGGGAVPAPGRGGGGARRGGGGGGAGRGPGAPPRAP